MTHPIADGNAIARAYAAYFKRFGDNADQPSESFTEVFNKDGAAYVQLANSGRVLATYKVKPSTGPSGYKLELVVHGPLSIDNRFEY